jgi:ligand-binding SRPBCC domain-containing protein
MPESKTASILDCSAAQLRAFLGCPANLPIISDPDLELEILSAPEIVTLGQRIEFRITAYGFKQRATHEYVTVEDLQITENQVDGPLRAWNHAQQIEIVSDSQCRLHDHIVFEPPGGMLGYLLTESKVLASIQDGMQIRYETLTDLIKSGKLA